MQFTNSTQTIIKPTLGIVATSEPNASKAGLEILEKGGNAIDAAIATAACLTVTEPTSNGIGGDNFAILSVQGKIIGMNSSGQAPELFSIENLKKQGYDHIPMQDILPVTVPGAVKGWVTLSEKYGKLPFKDVLAPAIRLAKQGYQIAPTVQKNWAKAKAIYEKRHTDPVFKAWFDTFGDVPDKDGIVYLKDHAKTLEMIADTKGDAFYQGQLADQIDQFSIEHNGFIRKQDLASHEVDWVTPIYTSYHGYDIYELPPNTQGIIGLMSLNILENKTIKTMDDNNIYHNQIEAIKLAFADGLKYISDPKAMKVTVDQLLSKSYAKKRSNLITHEALMPHFGTPDQTGTVYLATADTMGNMVSMIQSNYMGFGSGVVVPNTGIALQNRGHNFNIDENHVNVLRPFKKPYHTIIPGFIAKDQIPLGPFGVMGGFMQPQGHLQVISSMIDLNLNPQEALDRPRFQWIKEKTVHVEPNLDEAIINDLNARGHAIEINSNLGTFGRGQIILNLNGTYHAGTEKRCDGTISYK